MAQNTNKSEWSRISKDTVVLFSVVFGSKIYLVLNFCLIKKGWQTCFNTGRKM
jgi:hypothetical protein